MSKKNKKQNPKIEDRENRTDWDQYYTKPYRLAGFTRGVITRVLIRYLRRHLGKVLDESLPGGDLTVIEFGGGNSCFYGPLTREFAVKQYCIVDNNRAGLDEFSRRCGDPPDIRLICGDILAPDVKKTIGTRGQLVFSVGLIEHFDEAGTRRAVGAHMDVLEAGGLLVLGFPTPTLLYRLTRKVSELLGLWIFHDERPLGIPEVLDGLTDRVEILEKRIIRSIFLTQAMLVLRKRPGLTDR